MVWTKRTPLGGPPQRRLSEVWELAGGDGVEASFEVRVDVGKPLDVMTLKGTDLKDIQEEAAFLRETAGTLYGPDSERRELTGCPCCDADTGRSLEEFSVFGVPYRRCWRCGHAFVRSQPTDEALSRVFSQSDRYAADYTDRDSLEVRIEQVVKPKLDWVREAYEEHCGRQPATVVDVGAGGGHFVEVCRREGMRAEGYEISSASRRFARQAFGIELLDEDFLSLSDQASEVDMVTFWGLLEYIPDPRRFLEAARGRLDPHDGMLIVEVPRFDCLGTAVQRECPETLVRHVVPTSHVNLFSDASLASALYLAGFEPVAVWYYGMDIYELLVQLALRLDDAELMGRAADLIPGLQASLDAGRLCDDIVVAAVPR